MRLARVRDFAKECGCTPQNVYKHMRNYADDLEGHVFDSPRGKQLDEFACDFIRQAMYPKELDADSEYIKTAQELAEMRSAFMELGQKHLEISTELLQTQGELDRALLDLKQHQKLLKAAEEMEAAQKEELAKAKQAAAEATEKAARMEAERDAAVSQNEALKKRGLLARIFRKGE